MEAAVMGYCKLSVPSVPAARCSWEAVHVICQTPKERECALDRHWHWDFQVYLKQSDWAFFWLAEWCWGGVAALQNFWRPCFTTLPLSSFYCSQFFLIFLSVLYALSTVSFNFFLFISTVDSGVTSHMALPSGTTSLTHSFWVSTLSLASVC